MTSDMCAVRYVPGLGGGGRCKEDVHNAGVGVLALAGCYMQLQRHNLQKPRLQHVSKGNNILRRMAMSLYTQSMTSHHIIN